jgi:hypothetical protein
VEPRGIEPLYPSVKHGFLTVRWPLELHGSRVAFFEKKERPRKFSDFQGRIKSVLDKGSIAHLSILSRLSLVQYNMSPK